MSFPRPLCGECSNNINIIKWLEYLALDVTYNQVNEPHIVDFVGINFGAPTIVEIHKLEVKFDLLCLVVKVIVSSFRYEVIVSNLILCHFV